MTNETKHTQTGWHIAASAETSPQQYVTYRGDGYSLTYEQAQFVAAAANERDALRAEVARLREALQAAYDARPEPIRRTNLRQGIGCTEVVLETTEQDWVPQARAALAHSAQRG